MNLKKALSKLSILIYFDPNRIFYININVFHQFGFEVILFYDIIKIKIEISKSFSIKNLFLWLITQDFNLIIFLSKLLILTKNNYWFAKFEIISIK